MQISIFVILIVVLVSAITDILKQKVYNVVTYPSIIVGFLLGVLEGGKAGFYSSIIGFSVGFFILLICHILGGMGAGDVKLMGAIGALGGYPFILNALFFSVLVGGIISLSILIWQGKLLSSLKNVFAALFTSVIPGIKTQPLEPANSTAIPFGFAICFGTLWALIERMIPIIT